MRDGRSHRIVLEADGNESEIERLRVGIVPRGTPFRRTEKRLAAVLVNTCSRATEGEDAGQQIGQGQGSILLRQAGAHASQPEFRHSQNLAMVSL